MASQQVRISSPTDILRAVGFVVLIVVAVVLLAPRRHYDAIKEIDYTGDLASARALAPYHVLAPQGLAVGWKPTSVRYVEQDGHTMWHLGYLSPAEEYVGIEQSDGPAEVWIRQQTHGGRPEGTMPVDGQTWTMRYQADKDLRSLAVTEDGVTTVVAGIASYQTLAELALSLE
ncbi:MAG: DUF4245 domain-containing protein [Sporichthyaceae bacterium]|nr:DUF4245 domain-containing protein [Sporichthyaceae bacterium]